MALGCLNTKIIPALQAELTPEQASCLLIFYPRANGAKCCSGRKPWTRVNNSTPMSYKISGERAPIVFNQKCYDINMADFWPLPWKLIPLSQ